LVCLRNFGEAHLDYRAIDEYFGLRRRVSSHFDEFSGVTLRTGDAEMLPDNDSLAG
jgi:hypothetical protein